jgi:hypothetical protein
MKRHSVCFVYVIGAFILHKREILAFLSPDQVYIVSHQIKKYLAYEDLCPGGESNPKSSRLTIVMKP